MTNATKTLGILLLSLLVITGLVKWMSTSGASEAFRTELLQFEPEQVDQIEIDSPNRDNVVKLQKEGQTWKVSSSENDDSYEADSALIDGAISSLNNLNVNAVVSRDTSDFTRFKVDETGTKVSLFSGTSKIGEIIIGSPQVVSRQEFNTYVRPADVNAVYSVEGFLSANVDKNVDGWREKTVWNINRNTVTQIDLKQAEGTSFSIMKAGSNTWTSVGDTLDQSKVDQIVNRVTSLNASGFSDSLSVDQFSDPFYTITLHLDNGVQKSVRFKLTGDEKATRYLVTATDYPYVFTVNKSTYDNTLVGSREELLQTEE